MNKARLAIIGSCRVIMLSSAVELTLPCPHSESIGELRGRKSQLLDFACRIGVIAPLTVFEQSEPTPCAAIHQVKY